MLYNTITRAYKIQRQDTPLKIFIQYRDEYLDSLLRRDGRGIYRLDETCSHCETGKCEIRCKECFGGELVCTECTLHSHRLLPLHQIEVCAKSLFRLSAYQYQQRWDGTSFQHESLMELGLTIQLRHRVGQMCPNQIHRKLTVIHSNGFHKVLVSFCECNPKVPRRQQLLERGWWPATPLDPQTVATFEVLRQFQYQNLQGNLTAYDFYHALEMQTDGRLSIAIPVRIIFWRSRFLLTPSHAVSRSGCHRLCAWCESGAIASNSNVPARLTIATESIPPKLGTWQSPAGCVLSQGRIFQMGGNSRQRKRQWIVVLLHPSNTDLSRRFLYILFLYIDANFRLKCRSRQSQRVDVSLSPGWAYFVENKAYLEYVRKFANQEEVSISQFPLITPYH